MILESLYRQCNKECHYRKQYRFLWYWICIYIFPDKKQNHIPMSFVKVSQLLPNLKEHQSQVFVGEGTISE